MTVAGMHARPKPRWRQGSGSPERRFEEIRYAASCLRGLHEPVVRQVRALHDLPGYKFSDTARVLLDALEDLIFEVEQHERKAEQAAAEHRAKFAERCDVDGVEVSSWDL